MDVTMRANQNYLKILPMSLQMDASHLPVPIWTRRPGLGLFQCGYKQP